MQAFGARYPQLRGVGANSLAMRYFLLRCLGAMVFELLPDLVALGDAGTANGLRNATLPYQSESLLSMEPGTEAASTSRRMAAKRVAVTALYASASSQRGREPGLDRSDGASPF